MPKFSEIYERIMDGECDEDLELLFDALEHRRRIVRQRKSVEMASTLRKGDKVRLHGLRPKSLNGMIVEVIEIRNTRFTANVPERGISAIPLDCATKI